MNMNITKPTRRTAEDLAAIVALLVIAVLKPSFAEPAIAAIVGIGASARNRHAAGN